MCEYQSNKVQKKNKNRAKQGKNKDHSYLFPLFCLSVSKSWKVTASAIPCNIYICNFCIVQSYYSYQVCAIYFYSLHPFHWDIMEHKVPEMWLCCKRWIFGFHLVQCFHQTELFSGKQSSFICWADISLMRHHLPISCSGQYHLLLHFADFRREQPFNTLVLFAFHSLNLDYKPHKTSFFSWMAQSFLIQPVHTKKSLATPCL